VVLPSLRNGAIRVLEVQMAGKDCKSLNVVFFWAISANVSSAQMLVRGLASIKMYLGPFWNASKSETVLCGGVQSLPK
jgi:hypothetical protein